MADPELKAIDAYGLRHEGASIDGGDIARPAVFALDAQGIIRWRHLPSNWRVRSSPEDLLKAVKEL